MRALLDRWPGLLGWTLWAVAVLSLVAWWAAPAVLGDALSCELTPGSSVYGRADRSWLPPGATCTYPPAATGRSGVLVVGPPPWRLAVVAVAGAGVAVLVGRAPRRRRSARAGEGVR